MQPRILIVDDEPAILFSLRTYFGRVGFFVDCASEFAEAESMLVQNRYSLLIVDLRLSAGTASEGLELVSRMRSENKSTAIIVLTAYGSPEVTREAQQRGAHTVLHKPQPLAEIAQIALALLPGDAAAGMCRSADAG